MSSGLRAANVIVSSILGHSSCLAGLGEVCSTDIQHKRGCRSEGEVPERLSEEVPSLLPEPAIGAGGSTDRSPRKVLGAGPRELLCLYPGRFLQTLL